MYLLLFQPQTPVSRLTGTGVAVQYLCETPEYSILIDSFHIDVND